MNEPKQLPIIFRYRYLWHVLFWVVMYLGYVISYGGYGQGDYRNEAVINAILLPVRMLFTYIMLYILVPKFLLLKKYRKFILGTLVHAFLFGLAIWWVFRFIINIEDYACNSDYPIIYFNKIFVSIIGNYGIPLTAMIFKLFKWWYLDQQYKLELEHGKLTSELKYLKGQIHPHFLFNTLNNLYALTLKNSDKASDVVLKLANLLDYMIYHSNADKVKLEKELGIIESYIELEKIRYGDRLELDYQVNGDTNTAEIAPLILFPFIENAFKHGASKDRSNPKISIDITVVENSCVILTVKNSLPVEKIENNHGGIGLKNIRRQLDLQYPDKHELKIEKREKSFEVYLNIMCKSLVENKFK
jgi:two-component system, LytTR family, sensor kinase